MKDGCGPPRLAATMTTPAAAAARHSAQSSTPWFPTIAARKLLELGSRWLGFYPFGTCYLEVARIVRPWAAKLDLSNESHGISWLRNQKCNSGCCGSRPCAGLRRNTTGRIHLATAVCDLTSRLQYFCQSRSTSPRAKPDKSSNPAVTHAVCLSQVPADLGLRQAKSLNRASRFDGPWPPSARLRKSFFARHGALGNRKAVGLGSCVFLA